MIIAPVNYLTTIYQLEELIAAGVEEFYMGYMPKKWYQKYGWEISTNRRFFPVIPHIIDKDKAEELISFIHLRGKRVFLALNEFQYSASQYNLLFKIIDFFEKAGINGYIISDLAFILAMKNKGINKEIYLSSCAGCYNLSTLSFYKKFGINHFILPRKLSLEEIAYFLENTSEETKFEIFLIGEMCKYNEPICFASHGFHREHFCSENFKQYLVNKKKRTQEYISRSHDINPWCGLCAIASLNKYKDRLVYKVPVRDVSYPGVDLVDLIKKIGRVLKKRKITRKDCQKILGNNCKKGVACMYQF